MFVDDTKKEKYSDFSFVRMKTIKMVIKRIRYIVYEMSNLFLNFAISPTCAGVRGRFPAITRVFVFDSEQLIVWAIR